MSQDTFKLQFNSKAFVHKVCPQFEFCSRSRPKSYSVSTRKSFKNMYKMNILFIFRSTIKFLSSLSLIPFEWQDNITHFGNLRLKRKGKRFIWYIWCLLLWTRTLLLVIKLLCQVINQQISLGIGVIFFLWISVFTASCFLTIHPIVKMQEFCATFNAFKTFEKTHGLSKAICL